jgi:hypothetical protein
MHGAGGTQILCLVVLSVYAVESLLYAFSFPLLSSVRLLSRWQYADTTSMMTRI